MSYRAARVAGCSRMSASPARPEQLDEPRPVNDPGLGVGFKPGFISRLVRVGQNASKSAVQTRKKARAISPRNAEATRGISKRETLKRIGFPALSHCNGCCFVKLETICGTAPQLDAGSSRLSRSLQFIRQLARRRARWRHLILSDRRGAGRTAPLSTGRHVSCFGTPMNTRQIRKR
jgi:hypothetical protein